MPASFPTIRPARGSTAELRTRSARPHFAIITSPVRGHFTPLLVLANALHDRGGRVTFVHVADARTLTAGHPVGFEAIGGADYSPGALADYTRMLGNASDVIGIMKMVRATAGLCDMICRDAPRAIGNIGADVVLADVAEPSGALVARHLGLPFVSVMAGLPLHPDPIVPPPYLTWRPDTSRGGIARIRRAYAVTDLMMSPIARVLRRHARAWGLEGDPRQVLSPLLTVAQCPPDLDFPRRLPSPPIAWCGPFRSDREEAVDLPPGDGIPLIFCSLGTLQGARVEMFRAMSAACADVGARAVIAHCGLLTKDQTDSLPGDPLVRAFWPQSAILRHVSAAVIHGGFNTALDCLAAAVPMIVIPIAFEQPGTSARLQAAGAAILMPRRKVTRNSLGMALIRIMTDDSYRRTAQAYAARHASLGGANEAADRIMRACSFGIASCDNEPDQSLPHPVGQSANQHDRQSLDLWSGGGQAQAFKFNG